MRRPITTTKIKFANVSKPSQLEKAAIGSGITAIIIKTIGKRSQATEFLIEIELCFKPSMISISNIIVATNISICKLLIFSPKI